MITSPNLVKYKMQINEDTTPKVQISHNHYLVECIIKAFIQILQIQKYNWATGFHANFDSVDISTDLLK